MFYCVSVTDQYLFDFNESRSHALVYEHIITFVKYCTTEDNFSKLMNCKHIHDYIYYHIQDSQEVLYLYLFSATFRTVLQTIFRLQLH